MAEQEKEKKSISKIIVIFLLVLMLFMMSAMFVILIGQNSGDGSGGIAISLFKEESGEYTLPLDEFIVNLKPESNRTHFIKITISLMYTNEDNGAIIESNVSKIRDVIITTLRTKTYDDIQNDTQAAVLKQEIVANINETLGQDVVEGAYITDVIVQ